MTRTEARDLIRSSVPRSIAAAIENSLLPSIGVRAERCDAGDLAIGASRFGGLPDVPNNFEWPHWVYSAVERVIQGQPKYAPPLKKPLSLLAQFDLSEPRPELDTADVTLPSSGFLYFFYDLDSQPWGFDPRDRGGARVIWLDVDRQSLHRAAVPPDAETANYCRLQLSPEYTFNNPPIPDPPDGVRSWLDRVFPQRALKRRYEFIERYYDPIHKLRNNLSTSSSLKHRLFGDPDLIQNPMELECELVTHDLYCGDSRGYEDPARTALEESAKDWILLLQIDTDEENPGWMWGDAGRVYFWIRKQDLAARRFDDTWTILQCY